MIIILSKDGKQVAHWSTDKATKEELSALREKYDKVEIMETDEYYKKYVGLDKHPETE